MTEMTGPVLADEPLDRFQPLGVFGQPVHQSHVQLQAALKRRLGDRYASFFAAPRMDAQGNRVTWTSPVEGEVRSWRELSDEEQAERALDLQVMKSELEAYMTELRAFEGQGKDAKAATAFVAVLEQALKTPNDSWLYFVGDQPVSAFWGFREDETPPFETLSAAPRVRPTATAASPMAEAASAAPDRRSIVFPWWWLLVPLLLLLLAFLLWYFWPEDTPVVEQLEDRPAIEEPLADRATGPVDPDRPAYFERDGVVVDREGNVVPGRLDEDGNLVVTPGDETIVDGAGEAVVDGEGEGVSDAETPLEDEVPLDSDTSELPEGQEPEGETPADDGTEPETPEPEQPADEGEQPADEGEQSADDGEQPGSDTPDSPEPEQPEPEGEQPEPEGEQPGQDNNASETPVPDPGEAPSIPDDAADGAAGFMQGDWRSDSGLVDGQSGGRLSQEFNFDKDGKGETVVRKSDGVTCRAPAEATVKDGNLHVEEKTNLKCSDGTSFKRSRTVCIRGQDGQVRCRGVDSDGKQFDVQMNRGGQP